MSKRVLKMNPGGVIIPFNSAFSFSLNKKVNAKDKSIHIRITKSYSLRFSEPLTSKKMNKSEQKN